MFGGLCMLWTWSLWAYWFLVSAFALRQGFEEPCSPLNRSLLREQRRRISITPHCIILEGVSIAAEAVCRLLV